MSHTIKNVAFAAGVSELTRLLGANRGDDVSCKRTAAVFSVISRIKYCPNAHSAELGRSNGRQSGEPEIQALRPAVIVTRHSSRQTTDVQQDEFGLGFKPWGSAKSSSSPLKEPSSMRALWRLVSDYRLEVRLEVKLDCFQAGRLADLVQLLAHSNVLITDLRPDRSCYHLGLAEPSAEITFRVRDARHRFRVLDALDGKQFDYRLGP
jgi:hypothetical protein